MSIQNILYPNPYTIHANESIVNDSKIGSLLIVGTALVNEAITDKQLYDAVINGGGGGGVPINMEPNTLITAITASTINSIDKVSSIIQNCPAPLNITNTLSCEAQFNLGELTINDNLLEPEIITTQELFDIINNPIPILPSNMLQFHCNVATETNNLNTTDKIIGQTMIIDVPTNINGNINASTFDITCGTINSSASQIMGNLTINNDLGVPQVVTNTQLYDSIIGHGSIPVNMNPNDIVVALDATTLNTANHLGGPIITNTDLECTTLITGQNILFGNSTTGLEIQGDTTPFTTRNVEQLLYAIDHPGGGSGLPENMLQGQLTYADSPSTINTVEKSLIPIDLSNSLNVGGNLQIKPNADSANTFTVFTDTDVPVFNVDTSNFSITSALMTMNDGAGNLITMGNITCDILNVDEIQTENPFIDINNSLIPGPGKATLTLGNPENPFLDTYQITSNNTFVNASDGINLNTLNIISDATVGSITGFDLSTLEGITSNIQDQIDALVPPSISSANGRKYVTSGSQNIPANSSSNVVITLPNIDYITGNMANASNGLQVLAGGIYCIDIQITYQTLSSTSYPGLTFVNQSIGYFVNGSIPTNRSNSYNNFVSGTAVGGPNAFNTLQIVDTIRLNANDIITCFFTNPTTNTNYNATITQGHLTVFGGDIINGASEIPNNMNTGYLLTAVSNSALNDVSKLPGSQVITSKDIVPVTNLSNNLGSNILNYNNVYSNNLHSTNILLDNLTINGDSTIGTLTGTQLSYVIGATSNIQNQINTLSSLNRFGKLYQLSPQTYPPITTGFIFGATDYNQGFTIPGGDNLFQINFAGIYELSFTTSLSYVPTPIEQSQFSFTLNGTAYINSVVTYTPPYVSSLIYHTITMNDIVSLLPGDQIGVVLANNGGFNIVIPMGVSIFTIKQIGF